MYIPAWRRCSKHIDLNSILSFHHIHSIHIHIIFFFWNVCEIKRGFENQSWMSAGRSLEPTGSIALGRLWPRHSVEIPQRNDNPTTDMRGHGGHGVENGAQVWMMGWRKRKCSWLRICKNAGKIVNSGMTRLERPNVMLIIDSDPKVRLILSFLSWWEFYLYLLSMVYHCLGNRWNRGFLVSWPALNQEALVQMGCTFHPPIFLEQISVGKGNIPTKNDRLEESDSVFESQEPSLTVPTQPSLVIQAAHGNSGMEHSTGRPTHHGGRVLSGSNCGTALRDGSLSPKKFVRSEVSIAQLHTSSTHHYHHSLFTLFTFCALRRLHGR